MMDKDRMLYFDNLRLCVIMLVVCMHAAVTYSGLGSWYYKEDLNPGLGTTIFFAVFQSFLQAFFMGVLFMAAGYFAAGSLKKKGKTVFIKARAFRLGLPSLVYMLGVNPLMVYYLVQFDRLRDAVSFPDYYLGYVSTFRFLSGSGPMWFALALLFFCAVYALAHRPGSPPPQTGRITGAMAARIALAASVTAFAIRIVQPVGTDILNMQLCYFAQYVILFVFGIMARGRGWFDSLDYRLCKRLVILAFAFIPLLPLLFVAGGALEGNEQALFGGLHWQSLAYSAWESFTGVFMSIGLLGVLKRGWNAQSRLTAALSGAAFAVYMFHPPVLVFISQQLRFLVLPAIPKFLVVTALALPASFLAGMAVRRIPVLRQLTPS